MEQKLAVRRTMYSRRFCKLVYYRTIYKKFLFPSACDLSATSVGRPIITGEGSTSQTGSPSIGMDKDALSNIQLYGESCRMTRGCSSVRLYHRVRLLKVDLPKDFQTSSFIVYG